MKKIIFISALFFSSGSMAQQVYSPLVEVVRIEPRYVTVQQQQCQQIQVNTDNSGIGTVIGGVAGGIIGNQVGKGTGKDIATIGGAIVGGMVGNRIGSDQANYETRQQCQYIPVTTQKGEIVTFRYKGKLFTQTFE